MSSWLVEHEAMLRLSVFVAAFVAVATWERKMPRRFEHGLLRLRWLGNLGISALNTLLLRLTFPVLLVTLAVVCREHDWGLLNVYPVPLWLAGVIAFFVLDLLVYLQHVLFHAVPALWRVHRMHHTDVEFDVTTGVRFHPLEIGLSMLLKSAVVGALGPPAGAVLLFEILLNTTSLFNHGNVRIPLKIDRVLRVFVVTPDMHRVHHSIHPDETNSNFGFNLPWWDHLLGTYRAQPREPHETMTIGIDQFRDQRDLRLDQMLIQPWRGIVGGYPISRRTASPS